MTIVTRFAPSPTWYLHIWSLRTVLYNYLFAKKYNWKFMLRVEDTDRSRYVEGSIENLLEVLASVWLMPDEWPNNPWKYWPYLQSERLDIYKKYIKKLIENKKAYYCFCSSERLDKLREEQKSLWLPTKYDQNCRYLSEEEIQKKLDKWLPYTIRLKVPKDRDVIFEDMIKWKIKINTKDIDDQVLLKTDGFPTYHLANIIDDHLMEITHVIRWDEWTPSTPKHVLLYEAFGWKPPIFAHIPLLLWNDRKKLGKRMWNVSVEKYLEKWYLVESLLNYVSLLGWNPKTTREVFSINELIEEFKLEEVHKAWAIFDVDRLDWFNSKYLNSYPIDSLYNKFITYLNRYDKDFLKIVESFPEDYSKKILNELKTRIKKFSDFKELTDFFYNIPWRLEIDMILNKKMKIDNLDIVKKWLNLTVEILENKNNNLDTIDNIKNIFIDKIKSEWLKNGQVLWPVRVALSKKEFSPWALELIYIFGREKSIEKIQNVLEELI